ncbi:DUF4007 family protein [Aurantimonas coralicida]|uniref:DUF4007 family protein n=1 Tax=Aurantimonas coralicida TaxID=182270 RepID=UPI001803D227|nr:DUF4007 family protein [Aurantimonas coralicida]MCC4298505.1 DUF4007 family protein [Aurantimonas coralicida]
MMTQLEIPGGRSMRFSGHETFICRYAWLPKAYRSLSEDPEIFADDMKAMVELGLGKNMVRSLRFWVEAAGIAETDKARSLKPTEFAEAIFGANGFDPFLEDIRTLWLIHWNLSTRSEGALFAWQYLLHQWPHPEFTRAEALEAFGRESVRMGLTHSEITLAQHLDAFINTYSPRRSSSTGVEDSLDGPLIDLGLLQAVGQRKNEKGRWEQTFSFRREPKPEISAALFDYCVQDYWSRFRPGEATLTQREIALGLNSPGQVFKLPEDDVRDRLELHSGPAPAGRYVYRPSAVQGLLSERGGTLPITLSDIYDQEVTYA